MTPLLDKDKERIRCEACETDFKVGVECVCVFFPFNILKCFVLSFKQVIFSKYTDLLPKEVLHDDAPELQKPDEEVVKEVRCPPHVMFMTQGLF